LLRGAASSAIIPRMKHFSIMCLIACRFSAVCQAQVGDFVFQEVRPVPASVRAATPRKAFSIACFKGKPGTVGNYLFHLYSIPHKYIDPYAEATDEETNYLAVFASRPAMASRRRTRMRPHRHTRLTYKRVSTLDLGNLALRPRWPPHHIGADAFSLLWLKPKQHRGPIIFIPSDKADCLFFYPNGFQHGGGMQTFLGTYLWPGNSCITTYTDMDKQGFMVVKELGADTSSNPPSGFGGEYHWTGHQFATQ